MISASFASSATFTFGYVPGTNLESSIVTSAFTKTVTYEANRDLPSEIKYLNSGTSLFSPKFNYTYDLLGRATTRVRDYETNTFAYNPRSEVTSAYVSNTLRTYQYDDAGNRTLADGIFQHETNALNQYTSVGSNYSPTYDADGNQTSYWPALVSVTDYAPRSIEYDAENRAVLFRDSNNSPLISCQYDAYGRRFRKNTYSGNTIVKQTCFLYAGTNLIAEFDQTDPCFPNFVLNNIFFWDPTQPIATRTLATIIYYHEEDSFSQSLYYYTHDLTKNVWNITTADGYSGDSFHYDAFGTLLQDHGADRLHFLFSNEYYDTETGLYYYLFRYYNPFDGRWLSKDPIGERGGLNLYAFCGNNAVNTWDRWGQIYENKSLNETNDPYLRFLSGLKYDEVYRAQHERERNNCQQNDSLDCGQDKNGVPILQVKDDAGKYCCPSELFNVELRVQTAFPAPFRSPWGFEEGHVFIVFPDENNQIKAKGFYPKSRAGGYETKNNKSEKEEKDYGLILNNNNAPYDFYVSYRACRESIKNIEESIKKGREYNFLNIGFDSYNCGGMASKWLEEANFESPYISSMPVIPGDSFSNIILLFYLASPINNPFSTILYSAYLPNIIHYGLFYLKNKEKIHEVSN